MLVEKDRPYPINTLRPQNKLSPFINFESMIEACHVKANLYSIMRNQWFSTIDTLKMGSVFGKGSMVNERRRHGSPSRLEGCRLSHSLHFPGLHRFSDPSLPQRLTIETQSLIYASFFLNSAHLRRCAAAMRLRVAVLNRLVRLAETVVLRPSSARMAVLIFKTSARTLARICFLLLLKRSQNPGAIAHDENLYRMSFGWSTVEIKYLRI
jgi:hypothetical protein